MKNNRKNRKKIIMKYRLPRIDKMMEMCGLKFEFMMPKRLTHTQAGEIVHKMNRYAKWVQKQRTEWRASKESIKLMAQWAKSVQA